MPNQNNELKHPIIPAEPVVEPVVTPSITTDPADKTYSDEELQAEIAKAKEGLLTQAQVDRIVQERLAREKNNTKTLQEEFEELKNTLATKEFENKMIASNVPENVRTSLLQSVEISKMAEFDITPFVVTAKTPPTGGSPLPTEPPKPPEPTETSADLYNKLFKK